MKMVKKTMKKGLKMLGGTLLMTITMLLVDMFCTNGYGMNFIFSKAMGIENGYTCEGVIGSPIPIENLNVVNSKLSRYKEELEKKPNNEEVKIQIARLENELENAVEEVEKFKQTEAYQTYQNQLICNRLKEDVREKHQHPESQRTTTLTNLLRCARSIFSSRREG